MSNLKIFKATANSHDMYNGYVEVLRPLTIDEADLNETGPMFKCKAASGDEFDAFEDELT